jgi:hypothetical protein
LNAWLGSFKPLLVRSENVLAHLACLSLVGFFRAAASQNRPIPYFLNSFKV